MRRSAIRGLALSLALLAAPLGALAADPEPSDWKFSYRGFGTLGMVHHGASNVEFRRDLGQADGVKSNRVGFSPDSNLGLQLTTSLRQEFDASLQLVSRKSANGDYGPDLAWAFVKYRPKENVALRLGRLGFEMYLQGDSAEIGYANLMVRQPVIFYPRTFDGGDIEWTTSMGEGVLRAKAQGGWAQGKIVNGGAVYDTAGSLGRGLILEYAQGAWTGRIAGGALSLRDDLSDATSMQLRAAVSMTPNGSKIADRLNMKNRTIDYVSMALAYDAEALQGSLSLSEERSNGWPTRKMMFGNIGYRFGAWTPYVGIATQHTARQIIATGVPDFVPGATTLNLISGLAQGGQTVNQDNLGLGVRYDLMRNTALKVQLDRIRYRDPEGLVDSSAASVRFEDRRTKSFTLFSVALDFVF